jgi:hypothetical protein
LFLHVVLVAYVGIGNVSGRIRSVMSGETKLSQIALDSSKWPPNLRKLGNNFDNQFDVPTTWYALCALIVATSKPDMLFAALSWAFVITRFVHTYIHTGTNNVRYRMYAFLSGFSALAVMWAWFAIRLFVIG